MILLTGANGQLGRELLQNSQAKDCQMQALAREDLDITNRDHVVSLVNKYCPDVVINTAAYTAVDRAESERDKAFAVNAQGAGYVAEAANSVGARLIHISTDYVFNGKKNGPYRASDTPAPLNVYGHSKWEGEKIVLRIAADAMIIRTSWLYSIYGANFVKTILRLASEKEEISVVSDQIATPTWAKGLADVIWNYVTGTNVSGIHHWRDEGVASWYDFAVAIVEEAQLIGLVDHNVTIRPISTKEYPLAAERPFCSILHKDTIIGNDTPKDLHWRVSLRKMLNDYRERS